MYFVETMWALLWYSYLVIYLEITNDSECPRFYWIAKLYKQIVIFNVVEYVNLCPLHWVI